MSEVFSSGGPHPDYTDDEIWNLWEEHQSTSLMARITGFSQRNIRYRLMKIRTAKGLVVERVAVKSDQLLNSLEREIEGGGYLAEARYTGWKQGGKDNLTQQMIENPLDAVGGKWKFLPPWKKPLEIEPRTSPLVAYVPQPRTDTRLERVFIWGDVQLGFWAVLDAKDPKRITFEPFHDEAALDVAIQALAIARPQRLVIVGDFLDFPQLSRFQQEPQWAQTMQASIQEAYDLLCKLRASVGDDCTIDFIPGNHETRMQRAITNNTPALYNLTRPGDKWPVYSIPSLLKFEELNIECAAEYPSGQVWLAQRNGLTPGLVVTHADPRRQDLRADAVYGHKVLPAVSTRQVFYEEGPTTYHTMCVSGTGNYSDTSDKMRLTRTNTPSGRARMAAVQSFGTIDIDLSTGLRKFGLHHIDRGRVMFEGKILESRLAT